MTTKNSPVKIANNPFTDIRVGNWTITFNPKPIPLRGFDYDVLHDDYDEDSRDLYFCASSVESAKQSIKEYEEDQ